MYHVPESQGIHISLAHHKCMCSLTGEDPDETNCKPPRCPACVRHSLQPHWDRHAHAVKERDKARDQCTAALRSIPNYNRLGELQAESQALRDRLAVLRKQCADMAVRVAAQAVENDTQREHTQIALAAGGNQEPQRQLERLEQSLLHGSLHHAIDVASRQVRVLRFQWARKALAMHRLDIDSADAKLTPYQQRQDKQGVSSRRARGIGKIGGLPLPHAGPELYGVLPPKELQSALRLVASVTCTLSRCLGIVLPHPILLTPVTSATGDITDTVSANELQRRLRENHHDTSIVDEAQATISASTSRNLSQNEAPSSSGSSSIMSLMDTSYWKRSAKKALARATGHSSKPSYSATPANDSSNPPALPSMDSSQLSLRIHHATAAVLADDSSSSSSKFTLSAENMHEQGFAIALQLLQNDVMVLCIRAGVPVSKLYPAEAVLLNLYQLDQYCQEQTAVSF